MDLNFKSASLRKIIVHYIGSKNNLDPLYLAPEALSLDEELLQIIGESFLNKFNNNFEYYSFHHPSSLQFNEVYNYAVQLFDDKTRFDSLTTEIAKHLYESSTHPKVKPGELYVCLFEGLPIEGRMYSAVGLFKCENKSLFLDVKHMGNDFELQMKEGMELSKIDKGCLIIHTKRDEGLDVLIFDNQNRGEEALYWKEKFLSIVPQKNEYHQTSQVLTLTKKFITEQMESEFGIPKKEQVELLSKSMDYFKNKEVFDIEEFQNEVFQSPEMVDSFRNYGSRYIEQTDFDIASSFDISPMAVKKQQRIFKSVLKLDKNFHIYIHGNTELIEKGVDMDGRKYYKIYYQEES